MSLSPAAAFRSALASPASAARTLAERYCLQPALRRHGPGPLSRPTPRSARVIRCIAACWSRSWVFTRHADIDAILRDHRRFSNDPRQGTLSSRQQRRLPPPEEFTLLFLDPPDHTRLRALVNKAFARSAVVAIEDRIRTTLSSLLEDIADPSGFDLMTAVAQPLPVDWRWPRCLGVPPEDRDRFKLWSARRARLLEPTIGRRERRLGAAVDDSRSTPISARSSPNVGRRPATTSSARWRKSRRRASG